MCVGRSVMSNSMRPWTTACQASLHEILQARILEWVAIFFSSNAGDRVQSLGQEDPLQKGMATHPNILAWEIPWTEDPGGLEFMGS